MMTNLFSTFDPSTSCNTSLNWLSVSTPLIFIPPLFWLIPSRNNMMWNKITLTLSKEFSILIKNKEATLMIISLFSLIMFNNVLALFPYIFSSTSHMTLTLSLGLPLWMSIMLYGWIMNTNHMLTHQVPAGTPPLLMPFMVCIEMVSNIIRPGTLAIRLSANMIAGHLMLTLLGESGQSMMTSMIPAVILVQFLLLILESAVAVIQSYVFSILVTLYLSEVN